MFNASDAEAEALQPGRHGAPHDGWQRRGGGDLEPRKSGCHLRGDARARSRPLQPGGPPPDSRRFSLPPLLAHLGFPGPSLLAAAALRWVLPRRAAPVPRTSCPSLPAWPLQCHAVPSRVARALCARWASSPTELSGDLGPAPRAPTCPGAAQEGPSALVTATSGLSAGRGSGSPPPLRASAAAVHPRLNPPPSWPGDRGVGAVLCHPPDVCCVLCSRVPGLSTCEAASGLATVTAAPQIRDVRGPDAARLGVAVKSVHVFICALGYFFADL